MSTLIFTTKKDYNKVLLFKSIIDEKFYKNYFKGKIYVFIIKLNKI